MFKTIKLFILRLLYKSSYSKIRAVDEFEIRMAYENKPCSDYFKFEEAVGQLLRKFKIPIQTSMILTYLFTYNDGDLESKEDYQRVERLLRTTNHRRDVYNFMFEVKDITEQKLNELFPRGTKRDQLEKWLSES